MQAGPQTQNPAGGRGSAAKHATGQAQANGNAADGDASNLPERLAYALRYAEKGFPVIPLHSIVGGACSCGNATCKSPGKHPLTPSGVKDASVDPLVLQASWGRWPEANIGLAMGAASGLFAVDVDPRNGGDTTIEELQAKHGQFPDTATAATGGGGYHYLFRFDPSRKLPGKLGPGIDIKGEAGFIVAEPSNHISGKKYTWLADCDPLEGAEVSDAPGWIYECARPASQLATATPGAVGFIPQSQYLELRSALAALSPHDRNEDWIPILMALKSTGASNAIALAIEWSQLSDKFDPVEFRKTWATLEPTSIHVESIFSRAQAAGWVNPASNLAAAFKPPPEPKPFELTAVRDLLSQPAPTRWIVKGLASEKDTIGFYGPSGSGKTFAVTDLAVSVATGTDYYGLKVPRARPVAYLAGEGHLGLRKRFLALSITRNLDLSTAPLYVSSIGVALTDMAENARVTKAVLAALGQPPTNTSEAAMRSRTNIARPRRKFSRGWIGVDLDGTLATFTKWNGGAIGEPVPAMLARVQGWLAMGREVRVFTARVAATGKRKATGEIDSQEFADAQTVLIQDWTEKHLGVRLPVTAVKDFAMAELWDDRAVGVRLNEGEPMHANACGCINQGPPIGQK